MRTLAITQNITLDGSIELLGDWFDPRTQGEADMTDLHEAVQEQSDACDALLLGRQTFENFRGYWPQQTDDTTGVSEELDRIQKYVVTSTMTDPEWQSSTILSGDPVEEARALRQTDGLDIVVTGSITLTHALLLGGVVDELRLFTYPVVQGRGRALFPDGFTCERLELRECRSFRRGVTLSRYALDR